MAEPEATATFLGGGQEVGRRGGLMVFYFFENEHSQKFCFVTLYRQFTRALTFENGNVCMPGERDCPASLPRYNMYMCMYNVQYVYVYI